MPRYQVVSPHEPSECIDVLYEMSTHNREFLDATLTGCHFGDHTGYTIVEASSAEEVRSKLPARLRKRARVVEVEPVDPEEVRVSHEAAAEP